MATNPMQRKARNSFLLGMLLTLIVATIVIALLLIQLKNYKEKEAEEIANSVNVWVLNQNVISGQVITTDMLKQQVTNKNFVPNNAIGDMSILENYALTDKEGNDVITEYKNNNATMYLVKNDTKTEIKIEDATGSYYIEENGQKQYIELNEAPIIAKVDLDKNTVITIDMVTKSDEKTTDDLRIQEYNMLTLNSQLESGQYIDVRMALPSGQDYIVISKKQVEIPQVGGVDSLDTIWIKLTEAEIITMNNAIVETYGILGAKLYVAPYVEAGIQGAAIPTYVPAPAVMQSIVDNPNIVFEARSALAQKYSETAGTVRDQVINPSINDSGEEGQQKIKEKVEESIVHSKETRQEYLESLTGEY